MYIFILINNSNSRKAIAFCKSLYKPCYKILKNIIQLKIENTIQLKVQYFVLEPQS